MKSKYQNKIMPGVPEAWQDFFDSMINKGSGALTLQGYQEVNAKRGKQWEISREITASSGQRIFSVLKVGPEFSVDLKSMGLSASGEGVVGKVYFLNPEEVESFGTPAKWYNSRKDLSRLDVQPDAEIYPVNEVVFSGELSATDFAIEDRKITADAHAWGGEAPQTLGGNQVFPPGYIALFEILSKSPQQVGLSLTIYEGPLDSD